MVRGKFCSFILRADCWHCLSCTFTCWLWAYEAELYQLSVCAM